MACTMSLSDRDPSMAVSADGEGAPITRHISRIEKVLTIQVASCHLF